MGPSFGDGSGSLTGGESGSSVAGVAMKEGACRGGQGAGGELAPIHNDSLEYGRKWFSFGQWCTRWTLEAGMRVASTEESILLTAKGRGEAVFAGAEGRGGPERKARGPFVPCPFESQRG